ncbi:MULTISPECIES: hypothetical protein [Sphingobacterium]|jgi:hypothetical protein|uniref:hypothetical protein n=1 Tax=Sphingobacterium TaxID=28453 RepID=UPI000389F9E6|nr:MULTISPECIES: hypothetical protein [Sphingobacterium]MBB2952307.1 hypothetical protein [Sphingobacterium sp. JUb56]MCW2260767.1 hypothetical protein [Sphingobacterium kitahiroshimense]QQD13333.1 hypothetical protein JAZ75_22510 [Sphingobacterium sp. UDSM-2020]TCR09065.1 putative secreted protein (type I secretion substrate) [Sphingobacterium sp. JUb78]
MVSSEKIKNDYLKLLQLIEKEAANETTIQAYLNYLNNYKDRFINEDNIQHGQELREFLKGANRFSDEFSFSNQNISQIRTLINSIYESLNNS